MSAADDRNIAFAVDCLEIRNHIHVNSFSYDFMLCMMGKILTNNTLPCAHLDLISIFTHYVACFVKPPAYSRNSVKRHMIPAANVKARLGTDVSLDTLLARLPQFSGSGQHALVKLHNGQRIFATNFNLTLSKKAVLVFMPDLMEDDYVPGSITFYILLLDSTHRFPKKTLESRPVMSATASIHMTMTLFKAEHLDKNVFNKNIDALSAAQIGAAVPQAESLLLDILTQQKSLILRDRLWLSLRGAKDAWRSSIGAKDFIRLLGMVEQIDVLSQDASLAKLLTTKDVQWGMVLQRMATKEPLARIIAIDMSNPGRGIATTDHNNMHAVLFHEHSKHVAIHVWFNQVTSQIVLVLLKLGSASPDGRRDSERASIELVRRVINHITCQLWRTLLT